MSTQTKTDGYAPPYPANSRGYANVTDLTPHPKNREIYTDRGNEELVERIERHGFKDSQRLLVCADGTVLSGHRRLNAAKQAGLERVPVEVLDVDPDSDEALLELLTANEYREKTPAEVVNEGEAWEELEREKAKERRKEATGHKEKFPDAGQSRDKVGEKIGVSGRTYEKGKQVKEKAEQGDPTAEQEWQKLETGEQSIHGAYKAVRDTGSEGGSDIEQFTSQQTDEWSSPRGLVEPLSKTIGGFDLDPCSGAEDSPFAESTYTENDDGLSSDWFGDVWVNPPYSAMVEWTEKAIEASRSNKTGRILYLCKGDTSTQWWQDAMAEADCVLAIDRRLSFGDGENSAPFASHVFVFGNVNDDLKGALSEQGAVLELWGGSNGD